MKVATVKKSGARVRVPYSNSLNIKYFGENNVYPQELRDIVLASPAGRCCYERKAMYIEGNGVMSTALAETVCNRGGDMVDDITKLAARDLALYDGLALHVNYNVAGEIVSLAHVPFENCRLEEDDAAGFTGHVAVHPDWTGRRVTRAGRPILVNRKTVRFFDVFNPDPDTVRRQIERAGGIGNYDGQILYVTLMGQNKYYEPMADSAATAMSADEGIDNVSYRNVRNSFLPTCIVWVRKSAMRPAGVEGQRDGGKADPDDAFFDAIEAVQGDTNALKMIAMSGESDEEKPEVINIPMANYDKQFECTRAALTESIYAAFGQEQFYRLRSGSLGFSGEIADSAKKEYCEQVTVYQRLIKRWYGRIFDHWSPRAGIPYTGGADVEIQPLLESIDTTLTEGGQRDEG